MQDSLTLELKLDLFAKDQQSILEKCMPIK